MTRYWYVFDPSISLCRLAHILVKQQIWETSREWALDFILDAADVSIHLELILGIKNIQPETKQSHTRGSSGGFSSRQQHFLHTPHLASWMRDAQTNGGSASYGTDPCNKNRKKRWQLCAPGHQRGFPQTSSFAGHVPALTRNSAATFVLLLGRDNLLSQSTGFV